MVVEVSSSVWMVVLPFRAKRTVDVPAIAPIEVWTPADVIENSTCPATARRALLTANSPRTAKSRLLLKMVRPAAP
jgi:hypothetical protein